MPRTSDPTVRYLPPLSNPHETRRRRVSNIAICPPTYLIQPTYSTYLLFSRVLPIPPPPSIHQSIHPPIQSIPSHPIPSLPLHPPNHAPPPRNKTPPHNRRHNRLRAQKSPTRRTPTSAADAKTTTTANARKKFRRRGRRGRVNASES